MGWGDTAYLVRRPLVGPLLQPGMIDEYGAIRRMRIGRGNQSTPIKPAPVPLRSPQIPHDLTWDRTRASTVETRRLNMFSTRRVIFVHVLILSTYNNITSTIIILIILFCSLLYLFTCLLNSLKANYKVSTSKETNKTITYTETKDKTMQRVLFRPVYST
jgi:hypothetical protein